VSVGDRIREARDNLGLTQFELAVALRSRTGRHPEPVTISRWERGVTKPSLRYVRQIAELADLPVSWFFEGETEDEPEPEEAVA
jgi:transcriptional regulator with XRE-family HTH domain